MTNKTDRDLAKQLAKLSEQFGPEDLHPDLVPYVETNDRWQMIRHPLVYCVPYNAMMNKMLNRQYEAKRKAAENARNEGNWRKAIIMFEKPYRLHVFCELSDEMSDEDYWNILSSIWTQTENQYQNLGLWSELLLADREGRDDWFMDENERATLASLPDPVRIWRGFSYLGGAEGLSWTLDRARAEWFASRLCGEGNMPQLARADAPRSLIVAYLDGRNESEIVIAEPSLLEISTMKVGRRNV